MIRLPEIKLSAITLEALAQYQSEVTGSYAQMVRKAADIWPSRKQNKPFEEVLQKLTDMCAGAKRCCYCEDSMADEVEHIAPKSLYPELTFVWENYLYSCGPCNGPKNNQWAIFSLTDGSLQHLAHPQSGPAEPFEPGNPLLINPRFESPEEWMVLSIDLASNRLNFRPLADHESSVEFQRAEYTIKVLGLNIRSKLGEARKTAYGNYRARLAEICFQLSLGNFLGVQSSKIQELKREAHPTVWREIIRYRKNGWLQNVDPELDGYFDSVPEALEW